MLMSLGAALADFKAASSQIIMADGGASHRAAPMKLPLSTTRAEKESRRISELLHQWFERGRSILIGVLHDSAAFQPIHHLRPGDAEQTRRRRQIATCFFDSSF